MRKVVKSIGVISTAKMLAVIYAFTSLALSAATLLANAAYETAVGTQADFTGAELIPLYSALLAVVGFVAGAVIAFTYNEFAKRIGGVSLELEDEKARQAAKLT
ncbi:MAG TPA: hypothetical protein VJI67_02300 [archaeon]|nr:hypothetical protein [archaeon]HLD81089.1 hypothetical protein [archaeon]